MQLTLNINNKPETVDVEPETPLLWVLRDALGLTGTKYGCGIARCGACTVPLEGDSIRACVTPVARVQGRSVTTVEGLVWILPFRPDDDGFGSAPQNL